MHIHRSICCVTLGVTAFLAHGLRALVPPTQPLQTSGVDYAFGNPDTNATYDYVVVGGGTAGLTIASRLAAVSSISVAVIEAGGFYEADVGNVSVVPGYCTLYAGTDPNTSNPLIDWGFVTTLQAGANGRRLHYARGKTLGGSSARNFLYYHRPTYGSAEKWAAETGDETYTFSNLLPHYQKSVHYSDPAILYGNSTNSQNASAFSALGGPLEVSYGSYNDPFATWILPALEGVGQKAIDGLQNGELIGSGYLPSTQDPHKNTRSSSESSFLNGVRDVANLRIFNNTLAQKLLFEGRIAKGVAVSSNQDLSKNATTYILKARKEVIISAGTFQSPQLLMVSGIGPKRTLDDLQIPIIKDLPGVGQNLWDQVWYGTSYRVNIPTNSAGLNDPQVAAAAVQAYIQNATGPLSVSGTGVLGFEKLPPAYRANFSASIIQDLGAFPDDWPELEFLPASGAIGNQSNYATADPMDGYNYATVATALVSPLSRGNISISSANMADPPIINPNWLTHPADVELAIAAFKRQRYVWAQMTNLTIGKEQIPGPAVQTDEQILNYIRDTLAPVWHAAATCKMGNRNDSMAVLDSSARVYGVQRLRVVDASSFPFLPPGHPQATIYALAEKVAAQILKELETANNLTDA